MHHMMPHATDVAAFFFAHYIVLMCVAGLLLDYYFFSQIHEDTTE
jgi:hypothetical protein